MGCYASLVNRFIKFAQSKCDEAILAFPSFSACILPQLTVAKNHPRVWPQAVYTARDGGCERRPTGHPTESGKPMREPGSKERQANRCLSDHFPMLVDPAGTGQPDSSHK